MSTDTGEAAPTQPYAQQYQEILASRAGESMTSTRSPPAPGNASDSATPSPPDATTRPWASRTGRPGSSPDSARTTA